MDSSATDIMKKTIEVARSILQECVQPTVKHGVDVPVPQIQERLLQVGKEPPSERMGAEHGNHVRQSGDRTTVLCLASRG